MKNPFVDFHQSDGFSRYLWMCDDQFVDAGNDENRDGDDEEGIERQRCLYVTMKQSV